MIKLTVTYKGQPYNSITSAFEKAALDGVVELIQGKIQPFESEILASGGTVEIVANSLSDMYVDIKNVPPELADRVQAALR
jgi:hypothetical protein